MSMTDPRIDAYIARAADFAQPVLRHLRTAVHEACPQMEETIKWGMPFFVLEGKPVCMLGAFKQHCSFGFWLGKQVVASPSGEGMGQLGKLRSMADLPPKKTLLAMVRKAIDLQAGGARLQRKPAARAPALPPDFGIRLAQRGHAPARKVWDALPPGARREYIEWIVAARTAPTRQRRIDTALQWLAQGKRRNWQYAARRQR